MRGEIRGLAAEVRMGRREGLDRPCVANCDAIGAIPKSALSERIRRLSRAKLEELDAALRFVLGLDA